MIENWKEIEKKYGGKVVVEGWNFTSTMDRLGVDPKWTDLVRQTIKEHEQQDYRYDDRRFFEVFRATGDPALIELAHSIGSHLYHMEEARCGML